MMHHMFKSSAPSGCAIEIVAVGAEESFYPVLRYIFIQKFANIDNNPYLCPILQIAFKGLICRMYIYW